MMISNSENQEGLWRLRRPFPDSTASARLEPHSIECHFGEHSKTVAPAGSKTIDIGSGLCALEQRLYKTQEGLEQQLQSIEARQHDTNANVAARLEALEQYVERLLNNVHLDARTDDSGLHVNAECATQASEEIRLSVISSPATSTRKGRSFHEDWPTAMKDRSFHEDKSFHEDETHDVSEVVALEGTLWDAAILVGLHSSDGQSSFVGRSNTVMILFLLLVNVLMQGIFLLAIPTTMSGEPYDDETIEALRYQRLFVGHSFWEINRVAVQTRTANLCSMSVHNRLAGTWNDIFYYLQVESSLSPPGVMICMLAMLIWILSMTTEIRRALDVAFAVLMLPHAADDSPSITSEGEDRTFVVNMRRGQKAFLLIFVFIPRFVIAFSLLYLGMEYLADTPAVGDLILNACALEIVKNVDDLVFAALLSRRFQEGVDAIQIRVPRAQSKLGLVFSPETGAAIKGQEWSFKRNFIHLRMFGRVGIVTLLLIVAWYQHLRPVFRSTQRARDAICGYDKDFTYVRHPSSTLPVFASLSSEDNSTKPLQCFYASQDDLLSIRAGMQPRFGNRNETLEMMVNGTHPSCRMTRNNTYDASKLECPENVGVSQITTLAIQSEMEFLRGPSCRDQDVQFYVLRQTCLSGDFTKMYPALRKIFTSDRIHCSDFEDLCLCRTPGNCHPGSQFYRKANHLGITSEWIDIIKGVCPKTCGECDGKSANLSR